MPSGRIMHFGGVILRLHFINELAELVEIDARPEAEGMRNRLRRRMAPGRCLAKAGPDRPIDGFLERDAKLAGTLLQQASQIVVERQCRPHGVNVDALGPDVKTSRNLCNFLGLHKAGSVFLGARTTLVTA